jgi:hypothetical protein
MVSPFLTVLRRSDICSPAVQYYLLSVCKLVALQFTFWESVFGAKAPELRMNHEELYSCLEKNLDDWREVVSDYKENVSSLSFGYQRNLGVGAQFHKQKKISPFRDLKHFREINQHLRSISDALVKFIDIQQVQPYGSSTNVVDYLRFCAELVVHQAGYLRKRGIPEVYDMEPTC